MINPRIYTVINGKKSNIDECRSLSLEINERLDTPDDVCISELKLKNSGTASLKIDSIELRFMDKPVLKGKADSYQFYKEGLTVVGVAGARGDGDCDFELDPGFVNLTVSDPSSYKWDQKNIFCGEQVGVLANKDTGEKYLIGFVSAENYFCRIIMHMENVDEVYLSAVIDTDGMTLEPGMEINLEKLMTTKGKNVEKLLTLYADELGSQMGALKSQHIPCGWCSYYYYYGQETEDDILENARFLARHREEIPAEYIQIDDGWQKSRGNWLETNPEKYPHGMKWLATEIKKQGFEPGLWVAPFLISEDTEVYKHHQEWLLRDEHGELLMMGDNCFLDASHPEALCWLTKCFNVMKSWGYSYFKLDFMMVETCYNARYYDDGITRLQAYRKGLSTIRKALGEEIFILGGTALLLPSVGLVNGCRISTDVTPFWSAKKYTPESPTIFNVCRNIINRSYMHKRLWINDPDCLIVREQHNREKYKDIASLTLQETYMLASAMIMSGGALFLGDRMEELSTERLEIIYKVFALMNGSAAIPLDRMEREIPQTWLRNGTGTQDDPYLLAVFNWGDSPVQNRVSLTDLNLDMQDNYSLDDVWSGNEVQHNSLKYIDMTLEPHTCKLISIYNNKQNG